MRKLRLVKILVQPVFMLDDGDTIEEINHPPIVIQPAEWPTYASERFPREVKDWQKQLDAEDATPKDGPPASSRTHARARKRRAPKRPAAKR